MSDTGHSPALKSMEGLTIYESVILLVLHSLFTSNLITGSKIRYANRAMKSIYLFGHWGLTLLIAPFTLAAIEYIHGGMGVLEVYPIALFFGIFFSFPTFLVYLFVFILLKKHKVNAVASKVTLIAVSVLGIFITQSIIKGSMSRDIIIAYSVTAIIVGLVLSFKEPAIANMVCEHNHHNGASLP